MVATTSDQPNPTSPPSSGSSTEPDPEPSLTAIEYSDAVTTLPPTSPAGHPHIIINCPPSYIPPLAEAIATLLFRYSLEVLQAFLTLQKGKEFYYVWNGLSFEDEFVVARRDGVVQVGLFRHITNDPRSVWWDALVRIAIDSQGRWNRYYCASLCHDEQGSFWSAKNTNAKLKDVDGIAMKISRFVFEKECWKVGKEGGVWWKVVDAGEKRPLGKSDSSN